MSKHKQVRTRRCKSWTAAMVLIAWLAGLLAVQTAPPALAAGSASVSVGSTRVVEGNAGTAALEFEVTVTRAGEMFDAVSVQYTTFNGSAQQPGDYASTSGTLTFTGDQERQIVSIPVKGDVLIEPDETLYFVPSQPTNATVSTPFAVGTIVNDDLRLSPHTLAVSVINGTGFGTGAYGNIDPDYANGTVSSSPAGISCSGAAGSDQTDGFPTDCTESYPASTVVTLTATPKPVRKGHIFTYVDSTEMSRFTGWGGACAARSLSTTCTVTMSQARTVTATFAVPSRNLLTVAVTNLTRPSSSPSGSADYANGIVIFSPHIECSGPRAVADVSDRPTNCTEHYSPGQAVTLTASPKPIRSAMPGFFYDNADLSSFEGWGGACLAAGTATTCTVAMSQVRNVTATFGAPSKHTLSVAATNETRVSPPWGQSAPDLASGTITSQPNGINCRANDTPAGGGTPPDCTESYVKGTTVTLTATPQPVRKYGGVVYSPTSEPSTFEGWSGACAYRHTAPTCTVTMSQALNTTATFGLTPAPVTHTLSVAATNETRVSPPWGQSAPDLASGTITSQPNGINCRANDTPAGGGTPPDCTESYVKGTTVTLTATPQPVRKYGGVVYSPTSEPSTFEGWSGACAYRHTAPTCTVTMSQALNTTATFGLTPAPVTHTLSVAATNETRVSPPWGQSAPDLASGTITSQPNGINCRANDTPAGGGTPPDCTESYVKGTTVTLTATPQPVRKYGGVVYSPTSEPSTFEGWSGACAYRHTAPTCTVTMSQALNTTATFGLARGA